MNSASDILEKILEQLKINKNTKTIFSEWENIAGREMSKHLTVKDINNGILFVEADHPGWIQMADINKKEMLCRLKEEFPEENICKIKLILKK